MKHLIELNARNIVNVDAVKKYLDSITYRLGSSPEIVSWINTSLKNYIKNSYDKVEKVTKFKDSDPDWFKEGVEDGTALKVNLEDREFNRQVNHILDYFKSLPENELNKISKLSFEIANTKAKQWTEELNEKATIEEDHSGIEVVREYKEEFKWVKVFSEQSLNREGKLMKHCVGSYYGKVTSGHCIVYSLRNEKNIPKCTVEVIKTEITQIKGFANGPIKEKYVKYVKDFIKKPIKGEKYNKVDEDELQNIGILVQNKVWWNMYKLPKNFTVKSGLDLSNATTLQSLPEGLTVKGSLSLFNCESLQSLPEGLVVEETLNLNNCSILKSLPEKLTVKGNLYLNNCASLQSLPEGLTANDALDLGSCSTLKSLPKGLIVKGYLNLGYCTSLESLPEGLIVESDLYLTDCLSLKSLPEKLTIKGGLYLNSKTPLKSLPKGLIVKKTIHVDITFPAGKYPMFKFKYY